MGDFDGTIVGVEVYRGDVVVVREGQAPFQKDITRGVITEFSYQSRQRLRFVAANTDVVFKTMLCLTYPERFPCDGLLVKRHLYDFLVWLRKDTGGTSYLWFLEFQARGAPHIHIVFDWPMPRSRSAVRAFRWRVACTWYLIAGTRDMKHLSAGTSVERIRKSDGAARYAVKYATKMEQKVVPPAYQNVGRFWGCSKAVRPRPLAQLNCTDDDIRGALQGWKYAPGDDDALHRVLYGVADRFTGRPESMT